MNRRAAVPWLIVAIIALVVIIVGIIIVGVSQLEANPRVSSNAGSSTVHTSTSATASTASPLPSASAKAAGSGSVLPITSWNVSVTMPSALGASQYAISGNSLSFSSALESTLPPECSGVAGGWGISRSTAGSSTDASAITIGGYTYTFVQPSGSCTSATATMSTLSSLYQAAFTSLVASS